MAGFEVSIYGRFWVSTEAVTGQRYENVPVSSRSMWDQHLERRNWLFPEFSLNTINYDAKADLLLPRAVGYTAGFLDYFFRGRLDVDVVPDTQDPALVRLVGTNTSKDTLVEGTLKLYGEDANRNRSALGAIDATEIAGVAENGNLSPNPRRFSVGGSEPERYVAVYQGTLGNETRGGTADVPGGVIGKVLGGNRVEEVFDDGVRWRVRTPKGVFLLPLTVAQYWDVRWGDADDLIVAQKGFGSDPTDPYEVVAFKLGRKPGSVDFDTIPVQGGLQIITIEVSRARFPLGMALGTTVELNHSIQYRQQLGRFEDHTVFAWEEFLDEGRPTGLFGYQQKSRSISPVSFENVSTATFPFQVSFPLVLDADHNLDFASNPDPETSPYIWEIRNVTVDQAGRLFAEVFVQITQPGRSAPTGSVPVYRLNSTTGELEVRDQRFIAPFFPPFMSPVWALVDLTRGEVVVSTAGARITVNALGAHEGWPWVDAGLDRPHVWGHTTVEYQGGPQNGQEDRGWAPVNIAELRTTPVSGFSELNVNADFTFGFSTSPGSFSAINADGWARDELKTPLVGLGQFAFQVSSTVDTKEYLYACAAIPCPAIRVNTALSKVRGTRLQQAERARGVASGGRWLLSAWRGFTAAEFAQTLLFWDPPAVMGTAVAGPTNGVYTVQNTTGSTALVTLRSLVSGTVSSLLLPLADPQSVSIFPGQDLSTSFRLLEPSSLYHVGDLRFYRTTPALGPTALPAKLADFPGNPVGDYHVIRIP